MWGYAMAKVIMTCGRICSGKSTYAAKLRRERGAVLLSIDEIMLSMFGQHAGEMHDEYVARTERYLLDKSLEIIDSGIDVVLDWGMWTKVERAEAREFYSSRGIDYELHYLDIPDIVWRERISKRNLAISENGLNAYYIDDNLAAKFGAIFESPNDNEIDVRVPAYEVRRIACDEVNAALEIALEVFMQFEAPDYNPEGVETFKSFIHSEELINGFKQGVCPMYGAFDNDKLIGIIGMRKNKTHINLVFVKKEYQRKGVATAIFRYLLDDLLKENPALSEITLNSSPYGLPFYLHLGFVPQSDEQEEDGIRFTPMKYYIALGSAVNKSLEELENSYWEHNDFDSYVVQTVQAARKKPLSELTNEEIRVLTGQKVGLKYVLPMAVSLLKNDPLVEIRFFEGDLLECVLRLSPADWNENPNELREFRSIILTNKSSFQGEIADTADSFLRQTEVRE